MSWWPANKIQLYSAEEGLPLIKNFAFGGLWGSQILSQVAQNLLNFALIIRVFELAEHTKLANLSVALLVLSFGIPSIFFAAAAGVYVDHLNRKYVLIVANVVRSLLVLGYLIFENNLGLVLALSFLISTATQFFAPAEAASIPALVSGKKLLKANSLFIFTMYASFIVGYSASAPVIAMLSSNGPYIVTSIMFAAAGVLVLFLPDMKAAKSRQTSFISLVRGTGSEIKQNWQTIKANKRLSGPIYQMAIIQTCIGILVSLAPALSKDLLNTSLQNSSHILVLPIGLGMIIGVGAVGWLVKLLGKSMIIKAGLLLGSVVLLAVGLGGRAYILAGEPALRTGGTIVIIGLILALGIVTAAVSTAAQTMLQENTTDKTRGKVFGALNMIINIAATLPLLLTGILADTIGATAVITSIGALIMFYSLAQFIVTPKKSLTQN